MPDRIRDLISDIDDRRRVQSMSEISSDGVQCVLSVMLDDGCQMVAKCVGESAHDRLVAEADGLAALGADGKIVVPRVYTLRTITGWSVLLMDAMPAIGGVGSPEDAWAEFGRQLARHHRSSCGDQYGWWRDNYIGATAQSNSWCDDWVAFNAEHRLGVQTRLARDQGLLTPSESDTVVRVIDRLDEFLPRRPHPSLLHGDLWSGNALSTQRDGGAVVAVIDPAVSIGDGWADIAMMKLFGGFPLACFRAYAEVVREPDDLDRRLRVYQLYHLLNHLNLFGRGYAGSVTSIVQSLLSL